jgi:hypothetical protein
VKAQLPLTPLGEAAVQSNARRNIHRAMVSQQPRACRTFSQQRAKALSMFSQQRAKALRFRAAPCMTKCSVKATMMSA